MSTTTAPLPAWQRGYTLDVLRSAAELFTEHDDGIALGPFTIVNKRTIAEWLGAGMLAQHRDDDGHVDAALVVKEYAATHTLTGFTGPIVRLAAGSVAVQRIAWSTDEGRAWLTQRLGRLVERGALVHMWQEHPAHRLLVQQLDLRLIGVKIPTSSELVGMYVGAAHPLAFGARISPVDVLGIARLDVDVDVPAALVDAVSTLDEWVDHYSNYNVGKSWSALALRGFGGDTLRIEKPAEMSRSWQRAHPVETASRVSRTPLGDLLAPYVDPILTLLPGATERVRLMRLAPNGGRLDRHNDIGDPDVGTADGRQMRCHVPLVTNDDVLFESWDVHGERTTAHMPIGSAWYLDTRKPHAASNGGRAPRVHLVADVRSSAALRALVTT